MSHLTQVKTEIEITTPVAKQILEQTLSLVAKELGLELKQNAKVTDYYGRKINVDYLLVAKGLGKANGVGVSIQDGKLVFVGDAWAFGKMWDEITSKIKQYFLALAVVQAGQSIGLKLGNIVQTNEAIVIDLVR